MAEGIEKFTKGALKVIELGFGAKIQIIFSAGCVIVFLVAGSDDNTFPFL